MIRQLLKLIWNRRRSLVWIFIEQVLVFIVLFYCFTSIVDRIVVYYSEGKLEVEGVFSVLYDVIEPSEPAGVQESQEPVDYRQSFYNMVNNFRSLPSVDIVSFGKKGALPVINNYVQDSVGYQNHKRIALIKYCDANYYRIFQPKLSEGSWFGDQTPEDIAPAVITQKLADNLGITGNILGQVIQYNNRPFKVIGVVKAYKERDVENMVPVIFMPLSLLDITDISMEYIVKCKKGNESAFVKDFLAAFKRDMPQDRVSPIILDLAKFRNTINFYGFFQVYIMVIPTIFLVIFAFLGTFGLVWIQSKKRMGEFGIRTALGSSPVRLQWDIIAESLILTNLAMIPGYIMIINLYAFAPKGWEWFAAVGASIVLMWLFSIISAWYPAWKTSKVQPVDALRSS